MRPAARLTLLSIALTFPMSSGGFAQGRLLSRGCASVSLRPNLDGGRMLPWQPEPAKRTVTLTLGGTGDNLVLSADVILEGTERLPGWSADGHMPREMKIPFHVVQAPDASGPLIAELTLPPTMATVQSVTVHSTTYRGGRVWRATEQDSCTSPIGAALLASTLSRPSSMLSGQWPQPLRNPGGRR